MAIAQVEGEEIVIRIPVAALVYQPEPRGFVVTAPALFAPHVAREISGEDMAERPWVEGLVEGAILRAAEGDAPGIQWDSDENEFPPSRCNAWEDCQHDGLCHDPTGCGAAGPNTLGEGEDPCPVCGSEERGQGGYLACECPDI